MCSMIELIEDEDKYGITCYFIDKDKMMINSELEILSNTPLGDMMENKSKDKMENAKEMIAFFLTLAKEGIISKEEARFFIGLPSKYKKIKYVTNPNTNGSINLTKLPFDMNK